MAQKNAIIYTVTYELLHWTEILRHQQLGMTDQPLIHVADHELAAPIHTIYRTGCSIVRPSALKKKRVIVTSPYSELWQYITSKGLSMFLCVSVMHQNYEESLQ